MSEPLEVDVAAWVEKAKADPVTYRQRQAVEVTLNAIAMTAPLNEKLYLKGGILMGLAYNSPRQTSDVDLTAAFTADVDIGEKIKTSIESAFPRAAAKLGYTDLILKVHSVKKEPGKIFETATAPALKMKIAFAVRGTLQEEALKAGKVPGLIEVDISFNEVLKHFQLLELTGGPELRAYSLSELMAEKYRSMLQQVYRNRNRRQDVFDLDRLLEEHKPDGALKAEILNTFIEKCRSRKIEPAPDSLDNDAVKTRSGKEWETLKLELGELPKFEACYKRVNEFYKSLPWQK